MKLFLIVFLTFVSVVHSEDDAPRVKTPLGGIKGVYKVSHGGRKYDAYLGIPYALPPIGKLRFKPPQRIPAWQGELAATKFGSGCIQYHLVPKDPEQKVSGSEDCLYVNVYVPPRKTDQLLPVIFYIHGGGFQYGTGNIYRAKFVMDRDVILVNVNYRLGPFGFLSTEDDVVPGNMGLKDQSAALKWVSDNIEWFGGDPKKITLFGLSAGGVSVHYHYLSPMSAGLFQAGISFSGSALNCWAQTENSAEKAKKLAAIVGCPTLNNREMVQCLRYRPALTLSQATAKFMYWEFNPFTPFGPVVEKHGDNPFISSSPVEIIKNSQANDVPWIIGVTSEEGLWNSAAYIHDEQLLQELDSRWEEIAPYLLDFNETLPMSKHAEVAKAARKHYLGSKPIDSTTVNSLVQMIGDRIFVADEVRAARMQAKANKSPVWFYYYSYRAKDSLSDAMSGTKQNFGVSHGDDIYLFMENNIFDPTKSEEDMKMVNHLLDFVMSVANNKVPKYGSIDWPSLDPKKKELTYLHIHGPGEFTLEHNDNIGQNQFWESIKFKENLIGGDKAKDEL